MEIERRATPHQLAYLAGLIDGEGSISIFSSTNSTKSRGKQYKNQCYCPRLSVYNSDVRMMAWLEENFCGRSRVVRRARKTRKQAYIWEISRLAAVPVIESVLPYLVTKREQAELFLAFRKTIQKGGRKLSPGVVEARSSIMSKISVLNRKGPDAVVAA